MATVYRCAHCLQVLPVVDTEVQPCPLHPSGGVEVIQAADE